jgi:hypothetical protein
MRLLGALLCLSAWMCSTVRAEVVTLSPARDNTLFADANGDTSNGAGPALFAGNNGQGLTRRALLRFDLAAALPPGAAIDSVALALTVSNAPNSIPRTFTLHRVLRDWGEGSSYATGGAGAPAADGDATWQYAFYPTQPWFTSGGDIDDVASGARTLTGQGSYAWRGVDLTADVQSWLSKPATNHGWLLRGEESGLNTARRFESREASEPADRPALTIYYTGVSKLRPIAWGTIKARYRRGEP